MKEIASLRAQIVKTRNSTQETGEGKHEDGSIPNDKATQFWWLNKKDK